MSKSEYDEVKANLIKKSLEKDKTEVYIPRERRRGEDGRIKFINLMCFIVWTVFIIIISIIIKAGQSFVYITQNDLLWLPLNFWEVDLLKIALYTTITCIAVCTISIILNFTRNRRRSDRIKKSLIFCEIICFIIGIFLILKLY